MIVHKLTNDMNDSLYYFMKGSELCFVNYNSQMMQSAYNNIDEAIDSKDEVWICIEKNYTNVRSIKKLLEFVTIETKMKEL